MIDDSLPPPAQPHAKRRCSDRARPKLKRERHSGNNGNESLRDSDEGSEAVEGCGRFFCCYRFTPRCASKLLVIVRHSPRSFWNL